MWAGRCPSTAKTFLFGEEGEVISRLADTDYDRVAAGFGAHGERVSHFEDIDLAVKRAMEHDGPSCINLAVSGDVVHPVTPKMLGKLGTKGGTVLPYYDNIEE